MGEKGDREEKKADIVLYKIGDTVVGEEKMKVKPRTDHFS